MAKFVGKDGKVLVGANAVSNIRNFEVNVEIGVFDQTVMGDTWESHDVTFKRWTASVEALWDDSDTNGQDALVEGASVVLHMSPEGDDTGDVDYTGTATVTQVVRRAESAGGVTVTFTAQGDGALTTTTH